MTGAATDSPSTSTVLIPARGWPAAAACLCKAESPDFTGALGRHRDDTVAVAVVAVAAAEMLTAFGRTPSCGYAAKLFKAGRSRTSAAKPEHWLASVSSADPHPGEDSATPPRRPPVERRPTHDQTSQW